MSHVLAALHLNMREVHPRVPGLLRSERPSLKFPGRTGQFSSTIARVTPVAKIDEPFEGIDEDDEVCGIDFITLEPIVGAECRRMREEEARMRSLATAIAAKITNTDSTIATSSLDEDGYDFFGKIQQPKPRSEPSPPTSVRVQASAASPVTAANQQLKPSSIAIAADTPLNTTTMSRASITAASITHHRTRISTAIENKEEKEEEPLRPAFRSTPLFAEFMRQQEGSSTARILFLDEGGEFRASLGAALLRHMLSKLRTSLDVSVDCASLGPASTGRGPPSPSLLRTAAAMGIPLNAEVAPPEFDNVADAVRYDLILVMDRFDYQEVIKEIAILDTINPGGNYSGRVRTLGPFGMAARRAIPSSVAVEISDPLYDLCDDESAQQVALQGIAQELAFACRGLATYLIDLQVRCGGVFSLREALAQSLCCPLLAGELPAQRDRSMPQGQTQIKDDNFVVVRETNGQRRIVRRSASRMKKKGYWKDSVNVENELKQWMQIYKLDRLPTQRELRAAQASSLASAIDLHGGMAEFSSRLKVPMAARRPNGYWADFTNLSRALRAFL